MPVEPDTTPAPTGPSRYPDDEISLWEVLAVLLRRRGTIVLTTIFVTAAAIAFTLSRADRFTTTASFRPQGAEASSSQLMALATQFGVNVPGMAAEEASPAFYAELLTSREILSRLAGERFRISTLGETTLADVLEIEEDTEELRREKVIDWLRETAVSVSTGRETGTVTVSVETEWPDLSHAIATRLIEEVTRFNLETRQSQAAAERKFIAARVDSAEHELRAAEGELQTFLESNRQFENSPLLRFRHERLQRDVTMKSSVLTSLVQSHEQARIQEVRDTPVITVLQAPFLPPGPDERRLLLAAALGIVLGGMIGVVMAFLVEAFRRPTADDPARLDFQESWNAFVRSIPVLGRSRA